jgi:site-specific DNA-methyltransferase (adenine-specific)/modification methylase
MKTDRFSIIKGDCFELIIKIKTDTVDLILTDPPYNLAKHSIGNIKFEWREEVNNDIADWDKKNIEPNKIADKFIRVLKPDENLFVFCSYDLIGKCYDALDHKFDATIFFVWHKTNSTSKFLKNGFLNSCEIMLCCWNKKHKWNFSNQKEIHNFLEIPICSAPERLRDPKHPTKKLLRVLEHIIKIASNENDTVFDPLYGSCVNRSYRIETQQKICGYRIRRNSF